MIIPQRFNVNIYYESLFIIYQPFMMHYVLKKKFYNFYLGFDESRRTDCTQARKRRLEVLLHKREKRNLNKENFQLEGTI